MNRLGALSVWLCFLCFTAYALINEYVSVLQLTVLVGATLVGIAIISLGSCGPVATVRAWWHALVHRWHADEGNRLFDQIQGWASELRKMDKKSVSSQRRRSGNRFARTGLDLLGEHDNPVTLRLALEQHIRRGEDAALASARVFDIMASNAAVVGLLCGSVALFVLASLGAWSPEALMSGGLAFGVLTSFGAVLSGTVLRPLANRLRARGVRRGHDQARGMKGLLALWQRRHPERVRVALHGDRCSIEI